MATKEERDSQGTTQRKVTMGRISFYLDYYSTVHSPIMVQHTCSQYCRFAFGTIILCIVCFVTVHQSVRINTDHRYFLFRITWCTCMNFMTSILEFRASRPRPTEQYPHPLIMFVIPSVHLFFVCGLRGGGDKGRAPMSDARTQFLETRPAT